MYRVHDRGSDALTKIPLRRYFSGLAAVGYSLLAFSLLLTPYALTTISMGYGAASRARESSHVQAVGIKCCGPAAIRITVLSRACACARRIACPPRAARSVGVRGKRKPRSRRAWARVLGPRCRTCRRRSHSQVRSSIWRPQQTSTSRMLLGVSRRSSPRGRHHCAVQLPGGSNASSQRWRSLHPMDDSREHAPPGCVVGRNPHCRRLKLR